VTSSIHGKLACAPVPAFLLYMVSAGGLLNQLKQSHGR
jgi:hypothetical protein